MMDSYATYAYSCRICLLEVFIVFNLKTIKNPNRQTRQLYAYVANESSLKGCVWAHSFYKHCFYYKFATSEKIEWSVSRTDKLLVGYSDISVAIATLTSRVNQQWIISSTFIFSLLVSDENGARFFDESQSRAT